MLLSPDKSRSSTLSRPKLWRMAKFYSLLIPPLEVLLPSQKRNQPFLLKTLSDQEQKTAKVAVAIVVGVTAAGPEAELEQGDLPGMMTNIEMPTQIGESQKSGLVILMYTGLENETNETGTTALFVLGLDDGAGLGAGAEL